jgi:5-methylcytosine-specific restriction endonuclease McrA
MRCKKCKLDSVRSGFCQKHYDWWRAYQNGWRKNNPSYRAKENVRQRKAYAKNPEPGRKQASEYYRRNHVLCRERANALVQAEKAADPEAYRIKVNEQSRKRRSTWRGKLSEAIGRANKRAVEYGREGRLTVDSALAVYERQGGKCFDCETEDDLSIGHAIPLFHDYSTGGPENLIFQCRKCNSKQHNSIHPKFRDAYWRRVKEDMHGTQI